MALRPSTRSPVSQNRKRPRKLWNPTLASKFNMDAGVNPAWLTWSRLKQWNTKTDVALWSMMSTTIRPLPIMSNNKLVAIIIRVKDQIDEETEVEILDQKTKMSKVFQDYAQIKGVDVSSLHFYHDGKLIDKNSTPKMLKLKDEDQIDCVLRGDDEPFIIGIGDVTYYKIKKTTRMKKVFAKYAERKRVDANNSEFIAR